jgi:hypothetical protein
MKNPFFFFTARKALCHHFSRWITHFQPLDLYRLNNLSERGGIMDIHMVDKDTYTGMCSSHSYMNHTAFQEVREVKR